MISIMYVAQVGILAGIVMGLFAMALNMLKFTQLDLTAYMGCMLTGKKSGIVSLSLGFLAHLFASVLFAMLYLFIILKFQIAFTLQNAFLFGLVHALISGMMMPVIDNMNVCVKSGSMKALGYFTSNFGLSSIFTYTVGHIIYAIVVFKMLG